MVALNKKELEKFHSAYNGYRKSFNDFKKLGKQKRKSITKDLFYIESESSVKIESQKISN